MWHKATTATALAMVVGLSAGRPAGMEARAQTNASIFTSCTLLVGRPTGRQGGPVDTAGGSGVAETGALAAVPGDDMARLSERLKISFRLSTVQTAASHATKLVLGREMSVAGNNGFRLVIVARGIDEKQATYHVRVSRLDEVVLDKDMMVERGHRTIFAARAGTEGEMVFVVLAIPSDQRTREGSASSALVTFDFRALAPDGRPVLDLQPDEVVLEIAGRKRKIVALEVVRHALPVAPNPRAAPIPAPFVTNDVPATGRDVVLVLDEDGIIPDGVAPVKGALAQLIGSLTAEDRLGIVFPRGGTRIQATVRHDTVLAAVNGFMGRASRTEPLESAVCRSRRNLDALDAVFKNVSPAVPTTVVFVSSGFAPPSMVEALAKGNPMMGAERALCEVSARDLDDLGRTAADSRAHFYAVQAVGETVLGAPTALERNAGPGTFGGGQFASASELTAGIEHIAGLTGNTMIRLPRDAARMPSILTETAASYRATFEVTAAERSRGTHRAEVRATRPGISLRAPSTLVIPKSGAAASPPDASRMLTSTAAYRDLTLRVAGLVSRTSAEGSRQGGGVAGRPSVTSDRTGHLKLVVVFEPIGPSVTLKEAAIGLFDAAGRVVTHWSGASADLQHHPVAVALLAPPGSYRLRVAAVDSSGRGGTVEDQVHIRLVDAGPVRASDMRLAVSDGENLAQRLQFTTESNAVCLVEVYGASDTADVRVDFEVAESVKGPALFASPAVVQPAGAGVRLAFASLATDEIPAGDVVVRAVIRIDGEKVGTPVARTLRKTGR